MVSTSGHSPVCDPGSRRSRTSPTSGLIRRQQRRHQQPPRREEPTAQSLRQPPHRRQEGSLLPQSPTCATVPGQIGRPRRSNGTRTATNGRTSPRSTVYGPATKANAPLISADGSILLNEKTQILQRWAERFTQSSLHHIRLRQCPSVASGNQRRPRPPALSTQNHQGRAAAFQRKRAGSNEIPAEIWEHDGPQLMRHLTALFQE
ncbi:hypothetical protein SprV_0501885800 [Sparganum proliferum]